MKILNFLYDNLKFENFKNYIFKKVSSQSFDDSNRWFGFTVKIKWEGRNKMNFRKTALTTTMTA